MNTDPNRPPTRTDVAVRAGVSSAVVSYVVNNGPRPVAAATREKVLAAMAELGYRPNAVARALRMRTSQAVGLVVPDVSNTYFGALARELSMQAFSAGYALLLGDANNDAARERAQIESLISHQIDGLIVVGLDPDSNADVAGTPTVYLDRRNVPGQRCITVDDHSGGMLATRHLIGHGRRRIAILSGPFGAPGADRRMDGWRNALAEAGLPHDDSLIARSEFSRPAGFAAGLDLLRRDTPPDAVFVTSDVQSLGLLTACRQTGIRVPEDLAVISFDGTADAVYSDPPLTAVEQPVARIAEAALQAVLGEGPATTVGPPIPVYLVIRDSCGCSTRL